MLSKQRSPFYVYYRRLSRLPDHLALPGWWSFSFHAAAAYTAQKPSEILHMLKWSSMMLLIYLVVTSPYILSFIEGIPLMTRGEALPKDHTLFRAFTPQSAITFLLPAAPLGQHIDFETDTSMANAYIGLLALVFFLTSIFNKHSRKTRSIIIIAFLLLLFSFGDALPFWPLLFEYVPLFDHIRFPAAFRLFVLIGFIIAAAEGLNNKRILQSALPGYLTLFIMLLVFTIGVVSFFMVSNPALPDSFTTESMLRFFGESSTFHNMLLQSIIQVILLVILLLVLKSGQKGDRQMVYTTGNFCFCRPVYCCKNQFPGNNRQRFSC